MSQNLRQIKLRIKSIANTRKITRAMEMVSASKLNKIKGDFYSIKPYLADLETMMRDLLSDSPDTKNDLTQKRNRPGKPALCVITSDTGLCGTYNNNVIKQAEKFLKKIDGSDAGIVAVGNEAFSHFQKKGFRVVRSYLGLYGRYSAKTADHLAGDLLGLFTGGEADEIYVTYSRFEPSLRHVPATEKLLEIELPSRAKSYRIFEPSAQAVLDTLAPKYIRCKVAAILLEAFTSENSARMLAMKTATDNADDLTEKLTLARNKARQYAITKEVLEIAASAEALKG